MVPMPAEMKPTPAQMTILVNHGKSLEWFHVELDKMRAWAERKGVFKTPLGWTLFATNWLKKAIEFEARDGACRVAYSAELAAAALAADDQEIAGKTAAYHRFLKKNLKLAAEYLEHQPPRIRAEILKAPVERAGA